MQTIQQRTERLVWNRLSAGPAGRVITLAAIGGAAVNSGYARAQDATPRPLAARAFVIELCADSRRRLRRPYRLGLEQFAVADFHRASFLGMPCRIALPQSAITKHSTCRRWTAGIMDWAANLLRKPSMTSAIQTSKSSWPQRQTRGSWSLALQVERLSFCRASAICLTAAL